MSKNSPKQRLEQLQDWLKWREASKSFSNSANPKKFSKAKYYQETRKRYGYQKSN